MESTISYNLQDNFNNYELYTYDEGFIHYDFVENLLRMLKSNIKTNIKTWLNVAKSLIVVKFKQYLIAIIISSYVNIFKYYYYKKVRLIYIQL